MQYGRMRSGTLTMPGWLVDEEGDRGEILVRVDVGWWPLGAAVMCKAVRVDAGPALWSMARIIVFPKSRSLPL